MGELNRDGLDLANPWFSATDVDLALDGHPYTYRYVPAEYRRRRYGGEVQVKPPGVQLSVAVPGGFGGSVVIVPEDGWDLGQEYELQDPHRVMAARSRVGDLRSVQHGLDVRHAVAEFLRRGNPLRVLRRRMDRARTRALISRL